MRLLISMGLKPGGDRRAPLRGVLREIDPDTRQITRELAVPVLPAHTPGQDAHQELTSASLEPSGRLLQAAHTEVLRIDPQRLEVVARISDPAFHSLHSATPTPSGGIVVTSAATDSVLELDGDGRVERIHRLGNAPPADIDLRVLDHDALKPHAVHPNHALYVGDTLWVTAFEGRDCRALGTPRRIALPEAMPHDGRLRGGWLWFTQVTGRVVAVDPTTLQRRLDLDLAALTGEARMLGWCRGIEVVGSRLFVGFTMLRRPRHREALRLMLRGIRGEKRPTRVLEIDLDGPRVVGEVLVGNAAGGTIYAITAA